MDAKKESLKELLAKYEQDHLLQFWDSLNEAEQTTLYKDLTNIDYDAIKNFFTAYKNNLQSTSEKVDDQLEPVPQDSLGSISRTDAETLKSYENEGLQSVANNEVAVLLLAGGQGTRLGVPYPKGMYDVGLPSHKTLYQLQAERILRLQELAKELTGKDGQVPWYIMTSEHTKQSTDTFFRKHNFFGLREHNIVLFEQNMLPCVTLDGKVILEKKNKVARAPDGNGGLYRALAQSNIMEDLVKRGIKYLHVYCVDNILVKMADPVFIGFCINKGAKCGAKVVEKAFPTEPVGVVCKVDGVYQVVEYSEITLETAERRDPDGTLTFNAGNICNHFFTTDFVQDIVKNFEKDLKHHVAKKKIAYVAEDGEIVKPTKPNGIKLEKFVFDVFQFANNFAVWEVLREDEFSPLKNANGAAKDTPLTSQQDLFNMHRRWLTKAGAQLVENDTNGAAEQTNGRTEEEGDVVALKYCEISPLLSYSGEGLEDYAKDKKLQLPIHLKAESEM